MQYLLQTCTCMFKASYYMQIANLYAYNHIPSPYFRTIGGAAITLTYLYMQSNSTPTTPLQQLISELVDTHTNQYYITMATSMPTP